MTKTKLSALSMLLKTSCWHSAVGGMSFQSTHASRFWAKRASFSWRTKSLSLREYDMKTCATVYHPQSVARGYPLSSSRTAGDDEIWVVLYCVRVSFPQKTVDGRGIQ